VEYEKQDLGKPIKLHYDGSEQAIKIACTFIYKTLEESDASLPRSVVYVNKVVEPGEFKEGDLIFTVKGGGEKKISKGEYLIYDPVKNTISIGRIKKSTFDRFDSIQG
jgi:hypothetical protein